MQTAGCLVSIWFAWTSVFVLMMHFQDPIRIIGALCCNIPEFTLEIKKNSSICGEKDPIDREQRSAELERERAPLPTPINHNR
jgi:hypothetical protein